MASKAHCIYCFETLTAKLENRTALSLPEVELLWDKYTCESDLESQGIPNISTTEPSSQVLATEDAEDSLPISHHNLRPRQVSRLKSASSATSSAASTPSNGSSSDVSQASSKSSLTSPSVPKQTNQSKEEEFPLFVTWNMASSRGHKNLRGCIGTFDAQPLSRGLKEYALISAFNDHRFSPITQQELPSLSCDITLLQNFTPCNDALDWELGTHGIRISFTNHNRRHSSTYLPQVAPEQGWNKEETIVSLMRKAGWSGRSSEWRKVGDLKTVRYEGKKADVDYQEYQAWRDWLDAQVL